MIRWVVAVSFRFSIVTGFRNLEGIKTVRLHFKTNAFFLMIYLFVFINVMQPAFANGPLVVVQQAEEQLLIEEVPINGTVISPRSAQLSTEVSGIVKKVSVEVGDRIKAGEELLRINSELAQLNLGLAEAETLKAKEELADAQRRLADARTLAKKQTVSKNELDSLTAEVRIKRASLAGFEAKEKHQRRLIKGYRLVAPFDGVIAKRSAEVGEWVQLGEPVLKLVATRQLRIDFQVPQTTFSKLEKTKGVEVKLDAFPLQQFHGQVERVIPVTDPNTRAFTVRVALEGSMTRLAPGMSASAVLKIETGSEAVVVSRDALLRYPDGRVTVWQVIKAGTELKVKEQQVKTGLSFDGRVAVTEGLTKGATIVVQGNESLREGQTVTVSGK